GRVDDALRPLEAAARLRGDAEVRMLLARLYDHRDEPERAVAHLRALLAVDPVHDEARRLLDKLEREQRTEAAFLREPVGAFVLRYRPGVDADARRAVLAALETALAARGPGPGAGGPCGRSRAGRVGRPHAERPGGARDRPRPAPGARGLRARAVRRRGPAGPRRNGIDARVAGAAERGRNDRRRGAARLRLASGRARIAVAPT